MSKSIARWWVVAARLSSKPALANSNAPVHTDKVSSALDDAKTDVARSMFTGQVGVDAPEANPFSGNDIEAETPTPEVASDEVAQ